MSEPDLEIEYEVVKNGEEQFSIWPAAKAIPEGWAAVGYRGAKSACLDHVAAVWTDMRPASLRAQMDGGGTAAA